MIFQGKAAEVLSSRTTFGASVSRIRILATGEVLDVRSEELREDSPVTAPAELQFKAMAARIREEMNSQTILSPFESNIVPLPHQILALEKVMKGNYIRFLMADEVGMGKTIEAGLVLKELKLRGIVKRTLVIVPVSALQQWRQELKRHFNENFHIYDSDYIGTLARTFSRLEADNEINIWTQHNQLIIPMDALKPLESRQGWSRERVAEHNHSRIEAVLNAEFDLIIIDECHKVGGSVQTVGRYQMAEILCSAIPNVLLLSATPHRGKSDHFRRILGLLDSDYFSGEGMPALSELEPYVVRTEKRQAIDYNGKPLFSCRHTRRIVAHYDPLRHSLQQELYGDVTRYVVQGFNLATQTKNTSYGFVMVLFQRMISSSTEAILDALAKRVSRLSAARETAVKENATAALAGFSLESQMDPDFEAKAVFALEHTKQAYDTELAELKGLLRAAQTCAEKELDVKLEYLLKRMSDLKQEEGDQDLKFLIFTEFISTQNMLCRELSRRGGYSCRSINGSMDFDSRVEALKLFKASAQVLVSTDAAGESLNMQFSHIVINYDMPWNPMVLEQRIGRVDRIGQEHDVTALNLMLDNSIDHRVYEVIETKLDQIMNELGIDKTADVLDSTLETDKINRLYMTSLLDPARFAGESADWLSEIKDKLRNFRSTEGSLPRMNTAEITPRSTEKLRYSPIPAWLETMTTSWLNLKGIPWSPIPSGIKAAFPGIPEKLYTFDTKIGLDNPIPEPLTVQHELIQNLFNDAVPHKPGNPVPVLRNKNREDPSGWFMLWSVTAKNSFESREKIFPLFLTEEKETFPAYARDFWKNLGSGDLGGGLDPEEDASADFVSLQLLAEEHLLRFYKEMEEDLRNQGETLRKNREKAFAFALHQVDKIGIESVRNYRRAKYLKEYDLWQNSFETASCIVPSLECFLVLKVTNG